MHFKEGQIYNGNITISGGDHGPVMNWIIVSPFNKSHIQSIDDPLDIHCWPLDAARKGVEGDFLKLVDTNFQHPVVHLQRDKEKLGICDIHLGLHGEHLNKMLNLLTSAVREDKPYAPFVAGEILAFTRRALHSNSDITNIRKQVNDHLQMLQYRPIV